MPAMVLTLGDNAYPAGTHEQFARCYEPTWGRFKDKTHPSPGNHDYGTPGAAGFLAYFGRTATYGVRELGGWRLYALDSERITPQQLEWLERDLLQHPARCVLAFWHRPYRSSGPHGSTTAVRPLWDVVARHGGDIVLAGHDHNYQRFAPLDGVRSFVVGTGGASLYALGRPIAGSETDVRAYGVLHLALRAAGYEWTFVDVDGAARDTGAADCR